MTSRPRSSSILFPCLSRTGRELEKTLQARASTRCELLSMKYNPSVHVVRSGACRIDRAGFAAGPSRPGVYTGVPRKKPMIYPELFKQLEAVRWNKREAARVLAISRGTLYRKILEYALEPAGSAPAGLS